MANPEHVTILEQGVEVWNRWKETHIYIKIDLRGVDFHTSNLRGVNLSDTDLRNANFSEADLTWSNLSKADLRDANLSEAHLTFAILVEANLTGTRLSKAELTLANLRSIILVNADLCGAKLDRANLINANLSDADLTGAQIGNTAFDNVDLSGVRGLDTIYHFGPSSIGIDTIIRSQGNISDIFLREAGIPQPIIEQIPSLIGSLRPIDFYSCFISYSSKDQDFANRLHADLLSKGVRCWFAPHDLKIGDRFADRIEESIRTFDKLLIIISKNSVRSTWVEDECRAALEKEDRFRKEQQLDKTVLFPIKLDEAIKEATSQWVCKIRRERHVGDFTNWKNHGEYQQAFNRLLRDLKAEAETTEV